MEKGRGGGGAGGEGGGGGGTTRSPTISTSNQEVPGTCLLHVSGIMKTTACHMQVRGIGRNSKDMDQGLLDLGLTSKACLCLRVLTLGGERQGHPVLPRACARAPWRVPALAQTSRGVLNPKP